MAEMLEFSKKNVLDSLKRRNISLTEELKSELNSLDSLDKIMDFAKRNLKVSSENPVDSSNASEDNIPNTPPGNCKVIKTYKESIKKREVSDFVTHYNNRFNALSNILKSRDIQNLTSIRRIQDLKGKEQVSTIGMVLSIELSKNGHYMIQLEDRTGIIKVFVIKSKEKLFQVAQNLVLDEVIAVTGTGSKDVLFAEEIYFPDVPSDKVLKKSPEAAYAIFTGDIHVGSSFFYKEEFEGFLDWLNGKGATKYHRDVISKIKYLIIPGDVIDGAGIYPGQEAELSIQSIREQYLQFFNYLRRVPRHINMIVIPGNHDAMRIAEPQPPLYEDFIGLLKDLPNLTLVSSPSIINIGKTENFEGFEILLYHGFSMPYYADVVPEIREIGGLSKADAVMKFYLQRRHLAPSHGSTQFIPDIREDPLVIDRVPDFFVTGHIHKVSVNTYKGVTLLNTSGWVAQSEYQKRFGLVPDPCRVVLVNLNNRDVKVLNFMKEESND
jgi:DNA polymerase II small subunit